MDNASGSNSIGDRRELCGKTLGGYCFIRRIGGGATSDVFLARQESLGRNVAVKILKDALASDSVYVKRFIHEARVAAQLEHPNVARIYEAGELVDEERPRRFWNFGKSRGARAKIYLFIAQEYVAGLSLSQCLRRNGPITVEQTFSILEQIASALKHASDFNLIHRDVKPENIILDPSGVVHVVDFGLARPIETNDATWTEPSLTRAGVALGTPLYMSPEQARGQKLDSRSDVYSLGATVYHLLSGKAPFNGDTPLAVVLKHLNETPRPIRELRPDVPEELAKLIEKMLAKNPDERPDSPSALLREIKEAKLAYYRRLSVEGGGNAPEKRIDSLASDSGDFEATRSSFFQTEDERKQFESAVNTTAISQEWRANIDRLDLIKNEKKKYWTPRRVAFLGLAMIVSFFIGGGALTLRNERLAAAPPEPPLSIQRFNSVEEQYVFAIQTSSVDAWKSVIEYFPNDEYWTVRAKRQLALEYANEDDVDSAESLFKELEAQSNLKGGNDAFPLAGFAWCSAMRGDAAAAVATLSELEGRRSLDRMTEILRSKARESVQRRGSDFPPHANGGLNSGKRSDSNFGSYRQKQRRTNGVEQKTPKAPNRQDYSRDI